MVTSVYLIRHGDYDHRPSALGDSASDFGLTDLGRRQVLALRDRLEHAGEIQAEALYCSTLPRARQTADLIGPILGQRPVEMPELREWQNGNDAIGLEKFMATWHALPVGHRPKHRFGPSFESAAEFGLRVRLKLATLIAAHQDQTIVLVVHGGVIEAAFSYFVSVDRSHFEGSYPAAGQTSLTLWRECAQRKQWVQEYANDTHHLREL